MYGSSHSEARFRSQSPVFRRVNPICLGSTRPWDCSPLFSAVAWRGRSSGCVRCGPCLLPLGGGERVSETGKHIIINELSSRPRQSRLKGALQRSVTLRFELRPAQVPERGSTTSFVVLIIGNSESNHSGAQGTFKLLPSL